MQKSEKALFEEPYEGQLFFEWSSTLLDWSLHLFEWFFTLSWSETPLKEWNNHHSFWRAIWRTARNVKSGVFSRLESGYHALCLLSETLHVLSVSCDCLFYKKKIQKPPPSLLSTKAIAQLSAINLSLVDWKIRIHPHLHTPRRFSHAKSISSFCQIYVSIPSLDVITILLMNTPQRLKT